MQFTDFRTTKTIWWTTGVLALIGGLLLLLGITNRVGAVEGVDHSAADHEEFASEADGSPTNDTLSIDEQSEEVALAEGDLRLVTAKSNAGMCLHVDTGAGKSGGCGFDPTDPALSWMSGTVTVAGTPVNYVAGVAPSDTATVEIDIAAQTVKTPAADSAWLVVVESQAATDAGPSGIRWLSSSGAVLASFAG